MSLSLTEPKALLPIPSRRQRNWHQLETYAFVHFGPNTFTGEEWGHGDENPDVFNPKKLDCRQWVRAFKDGGLKAVILTAKHHDGFCLWPSKFSTHTVAQSKWRGGKGDVVGELAKACREEGMPLGLYLSPWDRNHPAYGTPEYNQVFANTLKEILTAYGPLFEVWFDGANGEGPNGKRQVYDWPLFIRTVRTYAPQAVIFGDGGPDVRWVGNEQGYAGETNWSMLRKRGILPGTDRHGELTEGHENGTDWLPAECDVSIRPGWFWRASEDAQVKSVEKLLDIYYGSVGRGGSLLLNVPPNSDGLISDVDVKRLKEFRQAVAREFSRPIRIASTKADASRGEAFEGDLACDGDDETYWAAPENESGGTLTFDLGGSQTFDRVMIREPIRLGQRIRKFKIEAQTKEGWKPVANGTTVGAKRLLRLEPVSAHRVRLVIEDARACPLVSDFALYRTPEDRK